MHKKQFDPTFVESCANFEVAHLSILMAWRLPYPKIPTLNGYEELCSALHAACIQRNTVVLGLHLKAQVMAINFAEGAWCCLRIMEE